MTLASSYIYGIAAVLGQEVWVLCPAMRVNATAPYNVTFIEV